MDNPPRTQPQSAKRRLFNWTTQFFYRDKLPDEVPERTLDVADVVGLLSCAGLRLRGVQLSPSAGSAAPGAGCCVSVRCPQSGLSAALEAPAGPCACRRRRRSSSVSSTRPQPPDEDEAAVWQVSSVSPASSQESLAQSGEQVGSSLLSEVPPYVAAVVRASLLMLLQLVDQPGPVPPAAGLGRAGLAPAGLGRALTRQSTGSLPPPIPADSWPFPSVSPAASPSPTRVRSLGSLPRPSVMKQSRAEPGSPEDISYTQFKLEMMDVDEATATGMGLEPPAGTEAGAGGCTARPGRLQRTGTWSSDVDLSDAAAAATLPALPCASRAELSQALQRAEMHLAGALAHFRCIRTATFLELEPAPPPPPAAAPAAPAIPRVEVTLCPAGGQRRTERASSVGSRGACRKAAGLSPGTPHKRCRTPQKTQGQTQPAAGPSTGPSTGTRSRLAMPRAGLALRPSSGARGLPSLSPARTPVTGGPGGSASGSGCRRSHGSALPRPSTPKVLRRLTIGARPTDAFNSKSGVSGEPPRSAE